MHAKAIAAAVSVSHLTTVDIATLRAAEIRRGPTSRLETMRDLALKVN